MINLTEKQKQIIKYGSDGKTPRAMTDCTPRIEGVGQYDLNKLTAKIDEKYTTLSEKITEMQTIQEDMAALNAEIQELRTKRQKLLDDTKQSK